MKRTRDLGEGFTDAEQAALYDRLHPPQERNDFRFYRPLIMAADAGLNVEEQYGDWDRSPLTAASPEIITIARRAR